MAYETEQRTTSLKKTFEEFQVMLKRINNMFDCIRMTPTWKKHTVELFRRLEEDTIYPENHCNKNDGFIVIYK